MIPDEPALPAPALRRVPELDALRAFAAAVVLLFHLNPPTFFYGWAGVDLFFVLSGYLITAIILRHAGTPGFLPRFYARRSLRIWPIYYLTFGVLVAVNPFVAVPQPLTAWPYYLTYTQNITLYWRGSFPPFHEGFDHTWTLALEEQFYLVWPALVLWAGRRRLVPLCLAVIALSWAARTGGYIAWDRYSERLLLARSDGFALGGLLAWWLSATDRPARSWLRLRLGFGCAAAGALAFLVYGTARYGRGWLGLPTPEWPGTTILAVGVLFFGVVGLVASLAGSRVLAPLRFAPLVYLGQISYGLYLYHYPIYWAIDGGQIRIDRPWTVCAVKLGTTLAVSIASWHLIERPILGLKNRVAYAPVRGRSPTATMPAPPPGL